MTDIQEDDQTEAVVLVDTSNAFNSLNREAAMSNIQSLCPPLAQIVVNTYRNNAPPFINGEVIPSLGGPPKGIPWPCVYISMPLPLSHSFANSQNVYINYIWYADDIRLQKGSLTT